MALELQLTVGNYNRVDGELSLTDTTGNYSALTNLTGYGSPNDERNTLALFISARIVGSTSDSAQWTLDPLTDSSFVYTFSGDGVYEVYLVALPFEASPDVTLLAEDYTYWDTDAQKIYIIQNGIAVETTNIMDNALFLSDIQYYLVTSYAEARAIEIFCSSFEGMCKDIRMEYCDMNRVLDAIKCQYEEGYYDRANEMFGILNKIKVKA